MIKYIHLRSHYVTEDENIPDPYGGATIAYSINGDVINYGIAKCYFKDRFVKRIGRAVASSRCGDKKITLPKADKGAITKALIEAYYCEEEALHGDDTIRLNVY